jgi:hypothetical protein
MRFMNRYAAANGMGYQDKWEDRTGVMGCGVMGEWGDRVMGR